MPARRCTATTRHGRACTWPGEFDGMCRGHASQAGNVDARRAQARAGRRGAQARDAGFDRHVELRTASDVRALLERAAALASSKSAERRAQARALTSIAKTALDLIERDLAGQAERIARLHEDEG